MIKHIVMFKLLPQAQGRTAADSHSPGVPGSGQRPGCSGGQLRAGADLYL